MTQRCALEGCRKKIKMTDFACKCEKIFCSIHRFPESHKCTYDFKSEGKKLIEKNNPVIINKKIITI